MRVIPILSILAFLFLQSCLIDFFDESIYGEGNVYYTGDPKTKNIRSSSAGGVYER